MNYTFHQLKVFLTITQTQSITKAAEELHLSQPAVSIQLKNLQEQFAIPLTEVVGRKLFVTDFGKEIAAAAQNILNEVHAINYKSQDFDGKLTGRLKISAVSTGKYVMPYFLAGFVKKNDCIEMTLDVTNRARVVESLKKNEVDFAMVSIVPDKLKLVSEELLQNKLFLVSGNERCYTNEIYDKQIFRDLPIIFREMGSGTRMVAEKYLAQSDVIVRKKLELTSNEAVKQAVLAGLGCSIMPLIGLKNELEMGTLQIIPIKGLPIISTWKLVWLKGKSFSPVAAAFLNYIRAEKHQIIKDRFDWFERY